ncbi:hypothetical protein BK120_33765 [Paenibacillus sp. FSL A5-0031]|uniref:hypothetical protein n=1 Tax=Paenibacillus sp. FSL A5-0031 TaxID=1920420 RepID=UPI00096BF686|nr:hypothetical protein [Paenibacillus sp. FSL A5-0031]OME69775.1 hypothetical protein BK120_33765 [Paenibacillus sp. FSL A5-0031]
MSKKKLKTFFDEKELEPRTFSISHNEKVHMVESDFLINLIVNSTPEHEQRKILEKIVAIDFKNGDVNHFLEHLAKGYVVNNF